ncbi:MAG: aspartate aminotransferase family protein [Firmicutes bacterium]|nr:aspartate aminotransferase family protein [Bacillota bacterium]
MSYLGPEEILRKKQEYLIPCLYHFYTKPMQLVKGEMQYVYDHEGRQYLDFFAGVSVINCGHCNPAITDQVAEQVRTLQHVCNIYLTEPIVNLAERLAQITPGNLKRSFFCSTGSEANDGAALLAKLHTKRYEFLVLQQGLHGRTAFTMSLTGLSMWRTDPTPVGGITFVPNAYCYRCPFGLSYPGCDLRCADAVERAIQTQTSREVAAMFVEPIQGNGGIITPPPGYFERVREILDKYGILLIVDEVQTGFARTGKMFAIEHWDVVPDIMTVAKALGNGAPISAFITTDEIAQSYTRPGASTLGGNPVSATAGIAVIDYLLKENLAARAAELGEYLREQLAGLKEKHRLIGDIRGLGLMVGAELVKDKNDPAKVPAIEETDLILEQLKDRGILIGKNGLDRNVLAFQPPLVITKDNVDQLISALDEVLTVVEAGQ